MIDYSKFNLTAWDDAVANTTAQEAIASNETSANTEASSSTEEVSAVMEQGDNPNPNEVKDPRTFSLQPLCEAYKLAGGVAPQQREIATQARVIEAGVKDSEERVDTGAPLAESEDQSKPESLIAGFDRTKETMKRALQASAAYLQREGNLTLSAQNGIRMSSLQGTTITGANTFLSTATTIINSQVSANASESIINLSDFMVTRVNGSSTTHVEDTAQLTVTNNITRATETSQIIANRSYNHGIDLNSTTGSTVVSTAGEGGHTIHSSGNVSTFTDSSILNLATNEITMGAGSPTSHGPDPQAEPNFDVLSVLRDAASFMRITSGDNAAITSVTSGDASLVARGSQLVTAASTYVSAANTAAQVAGRQLMNGVMGNGGNPRSHVFHQGRMIIQGRMIGGFPSVDMDSILFPTVPPLPPKPSAYSIEDLQACIPKSYRSDEDTSWNDGEVDLAKKAAESLGVDPESIRQGAASTSTDGASTSEVKPGDTATEQDINTDTPGNELNQTSATNTISSILGTGLSQIIPATSAGGGPVNVYLDMYEDKPKEEDEGQTAPDSVEEIIESISNEVSSKVLETERDLAAFIVEDLYTQGYRGEEEQDAIEGYISGTLQALTSNNLTADRAFIIRVMELMKEPLQSTAMGMFQDLGSYPSISLPHIGSIGQVVVDSFGLESVNEIIGGLEDITSFSGLDSSAMETLGISDLDFSSISSIDDIGSLIQNESLQDLIRNEAIKGVLSRVVGDQAQSFIPIINQILNKGIEIDDLELEDLIINIAQSEGIANLLPSNYPSQLTSSIRSLLNKGQISLDNDSILSLLTSIGGNSMPLKILSGYREIESIISNVGALASIPDLLSLMSDNDVPILSRASLLLSCLDIFNRVNSILGSFNSVLDNLSSIDLSSIPINPELINTVLSSLEITETTLPEESTPHSIDPSTNPRLLITGDQIIDTYLIPVFV